MKRILFLIVLAIILPASQASASNFTDNSDSTVTDSLTGLMWQQTEGGLMNWEAALVYCEGLDLATLTDWRLPNVKELTSLTDETQNPTIIDTNFFPDTRLRYWSSTTDVDNIIGPSAWRVPFDSDVGPAYGDTKTNTNWVRCVR